MCIPFIRMFICMFVGLPSWVCVVCGLVVCCMLVEKRSFFFSFGLSFPCSFSHALLCPDAHVLTWRKCIQVGQKVVGFCASGSRVLMSLILYFVGGFILIFNFL